MCQLIKAYNYNTNSPNKLLSVTDAVSTSDSTLGFSDGNKVGNDYSYDDNGNMTSDLNKKTTITSTNKPALTRISYNHLNLPTEIFFATTKKINYFYDTEGTKLQKKVTNGAVITTTDYLDGFQYVAGILQFFPTSAGYVNFDSGVYKYVYNYLDHLGNVRVRYTKDAAVASGVSILEENHYYPFGLKHTNYNTTVLKLRGSSVVVTSGSPINKYRFNGKEYQDELGLNITAMDFRQYDGAIGRFNTIDKLAELDFNISPFAFGRNNAIIFGDPSGLSPGYEDGDDHGWNEGRIGYDENSRTPGFEGQYVSDIDMQSGNPMGGTLLDVVVETKNIGSSGMEKPDKDNDSYDRERDKPFDYWNRVPSGEYGPSSMNPDAMSLSYSVSANGFFFTANMSIGIAITGSDVAIVLGGGVTTGPQTDCKLPGFKGGWNIGVHNQMGNNSDVLDGLGGKGTGIFAGLGLGGSQSYSVKSNGAIDPNGVSSTSVNIGPSFGYGQIQSNAFSGKLSDLINYLNN